jgi:CRP/FNR family cyclic AMP-dependent transcriptional regulator
MAKESLDMLSSVNLFSGLTKKELGQIHDTAKEVHFPAGRTIVAQGESGVGFHMILEGKASVTVGDEVRTHLGAGDYFGEIAIIDSGPRSASVKADTDVTTLAIASWDFMPLLTESFDLTKKILIELCRRLRDAEESLRH